MDFEKQDEELLELPEEEETSEDNGDTDFELDDDGNIIIPDDEEGDEDDADGAEDTSDDADEDEGEDEDADEGTDDKDGDDGAEDAHEDKHDEPDTAAENAELRRRLESNEKRIKAALKKLGVKADGDDVIDGIETLAAESEGKTLDEYRKDMREKEENEQARAFLRKTAFENLKKADLAALHAAYPETAELDDVEKMPNFKRFAELRDLGISVKEA